MGLFGGPADEALQIAASYDRPNMFQQYQDYQSLPDALRKWAHALRVISEKAADDPLGQATNDQLTRTYQCMLMVASIADEIAPTMRNEHRQELDRFENPRRNEQKWDVRGT